MLFRRKINEITSRLAAAPKLDKSFTYPYSADTVERRRQIWDNLQKGIFLEDKKTLIPWNTPFNRINSFSEQRHDTGDRTQWYLGERTILNGYRCHLEVMKWMWLPWSNPITEVSANIGQDYIGNDQFNFLKEYITNLLGSPTAIDLEKFGFFDIGSIDWVNGLTKISIRGFEMFALRYHLHIGLIQNPNTAFTGRMVEENKDRSVPDEDTKD